MLRHIEVDVLLVKLGELHDRLSDADDLPSLNTSGSPSCGNGTGGFAAVSGYGGFKRCVDIQAGAPTTDTTTVIT